MTLLLACSLDSTFAAPADSITGPAVDVHQVLPYAALDELKLPARPLRVASRPDADLEKSKLLWRPGLRDLLPSATREDNSPGQDQQPTPPRDEALDATAPLGPSLVPAKPEPQVLEIGPEEARSIDALPPAVSDDSAPKQLPSAPAARGPVTKVPEKSNASKSKARSKAVPKLAPKAVPKSSKPDKQPSVAEPTKPLKPLSRNMQYLRTRLRTVLSFYYRKPLNDVEHDPWEVMHSMLSYELHSRVLEGGPRGKPITAVGHLCFNRPTERKRMLYLNESGEIDCRVGVGLQGHKGQFLAMLAQSNVSPDYPVRVEDKEFTIHDLICTEQRTCYARTELTFKLIALGHYLASDASWVNDQGESWDIPRLIQEERTQPIRGAACGGTHRLSGLSLAHRRRAARGEPIDGEYLEAANFVQEYQNYAFRFQNKDGSLSTEWFRGPGADEDIERRLRTTGHLLEWLVYSLSDEQLSSRGTVRAVTYLTNLLSRYGKQDWHKGSLAHALHALVLYDKRVFQPYDTTPGEQLAVNPSARSYRGYGMRRGVMRYEQAPEASGGGLFGLFGSTRNGSRPSKHHSR